MNKSFVHTQLIKEKAIALGFSACGIAKADYLSDQAEKLEKWLAQNLHGEMSYMANHYDMRLDPRLLVPGAKSVISLSYNYFTTDQQTDETAPKISMYAFGKDYHTVVKEKLKQLLTFMREQIGDIDGRCFVDSAPVMERVWAERSGIGWIGKNTLLLTKAKGSYFFLAEIICDVELMPDSPVTNYCGHCTKCIDACPTEAIYAPYQLDATKCISYLTIELKAPQLPTTMKGKMNDWMYGCDICQQVCPINARAKPHAEQQFQPKDELLNKSKKEWEEITEEVFHSLFSQSAVKRTRFQGLKRNILFLKNEANLRE